MNPNWLIRMARWARNPPGWRKIMLYGGIILACLLLVAVERFIGWPDWLTVNGKAKP